MTPNPWERLREAAHNYRTMVRPQHGESCECMPACAELDAALAALPATPPPQPVPAPPSSDWRERFEESRNSTAETLCLRDGLIAAEDRIAALEAEVANLRSQVLP